MSLLDLPTAQENALATQQVIPSDARDFSRPREPFMSQSLPDFLQADDNNNTNPLISSFQTFLSNSHPLIPTYHGPVDGKPNPELIQIAKQIESIISKSISTSVNGMLWSDKNQTFNTSPDDLNSALLLLLNKK